MANEYLKRTPTSTGNRKVWTWSGWVKRNTPTGTRQALFAVTNNAGTIFTGLEFDTNEKLQWYEITLTSGITVVNTSQVFRDTGNWMHILVVFNSTASSSQDRAKIYVNGTLITSFTTDSRANININTESQINGITYPLYIGSWAVAAPTLYSRAELTDIFFIDGQALTPDVFGFYKVGKGYVSAGSTQSTDFRPGQWVPKTPRVIKTAINNNGGFGVNGFYLPMNDSNNFGADFHCDPNSIIKLQENLPQPRCRIDGVGDYTGALRDDPFKQYLVLALPFVSGGLQSGFGDYSAAIKGSGSAKTVTSVSVSGTGPSINNNSVYYGSSCFFDGGRCLQVPAGVDFAYGTKPFTVEGWVNPTGGTDQYGYAAAFLYQQSQSGQNYFGVYVGGFANSVTAPEFGFIMGSGGGGGGGGAVVTAPNKLPMNAWSHFAVTKDTENVVKLFLNGVVVGIATNVTYDLNDTSMIPTIGRYTHGGANGGMYNGYIQDLRIYKGVAKYKGGFDVPRPYTPVGIATWRAVPDSPANNFATMNPLIEARPSSGSNSPSNSTIVTFADGNLNLSNSASSGNAQRMVSFATIGISTGKWYYEEIPSSNSRVGLSKGFQQLNYTGGTLGSGSGLESSVTYTASGLISLANNAYYNTATTLTPPSYNNTNIIGVSIDASLGENNLTVRFYKDGVGVSVLTGVGATSPVREWFPTKTMESSGSGDQRYFNFGQNPTFSGNTTAGTYTDSNNKGLFKYQPPSGFLALCEDNLPTPAISDPGKHFKTVLYTGDGNSGRSITGVGFQPDLVWIKSRTVARNHRLQDSVRGFTNVLCSDLTIVEYGTGDVSSANNEGFSLLARDNQNISAESYVAWCWKAGAGTTSTNTNGSITSVVSVNQDAGFSIVSYTGNGTSGATVGHGINKPPKFIIVQTRQGTNNREKPVYHVSTGTNYATVLNGASEGFTNSAFWNNTAPSSSLITLGNDQNTNQITSTYIAYCWAEIEGFSKFGSYVGNGSADGPFVYCGFKPAWVIVKNTTMGGYWNIWDSSRNSSNPLDLSLYPPAPDIEDSGGNYFIDFLSNGFKIRTSSATHINGSGNKIIFAAYAESPFQTANAK